MDYRTLRVLLVEDDIDVANLVARCLEDIPIPVDHARTGGEAVASLEDGLHDIVILDLGLPDGDGLSIARDVALKQDQGLIILTGRNDVTDKVIGLEIGADDYVTKPFDRRELNARVKSLARRIDAIKRSREGPRAEKQTVRFSGWTLFKDELRIEHQDGRAHDISSSEYALLLIFLDRPGRLLSRDFIMDQLFQDATPAFDRSIDVRVSRLRAKLEQDPRHPTIVVTVRNQGYAFRGRLNE